MKRAAVLFVVLAAASLAPIWSNDYFWHSAAGSWIVAHHALAATDPLAVASSHERWIDGEWLFQVAAALVENAAGLTAISIVRALAIALFFAWIFVRLTRTVTPFTAACVTFFAWYGALPWLRERPAAIAAMLIALVIAIPRNYYVVIIAAILLINIHPSALLVPVLVALVGRRIGPVVASAAALLVSPYGLAAITNPFHVARIASLPIFANEEWAPTSLNEFRLFAVALIAVVLIVAFSPRRKESIALAFITLLALRFARNQTIFYCAAPILLEPHLRSIPDRFRKLFIIPVAITAAAIIATSPFRIGVDAAKFPLHATARVRELHVPGNIFSSYAMGGFLEWAFLPERRVLTDGRNELFVEYQQRMLAARRSPEAWRQFLNDYGVGVAYVDSSWKPYFPPNEWTPVAADRAAVVLARRR
ncbi:MAG TPA: hypothetical protein VGJ81_21625 [Thermoanaerobaculia bacterium]|jgi:hypothetical protein